MSTIKEKLFQPLVIIMIFASIIRARFFLLEELLQYQKVSCQDLWIITDYELIFIAVFLSTSLSLRMFQRHIHARKNYLIIGIFILVFPEFLQYCFKIKKVANRFDNQKRQNFLIQDLEQIEEFKPHIYSLTNNHWCAKPVEIFSYENNVQMSVFFLTEDDFLQYKPIINEQKHKVEEVKHKQFFLGDNSFPFLQFPPQYTEYHKTAFEQRIKSIMESKDNENDNDSSTGQTKKEDKQGTIMNKHGDEEILEDKTDSNNEDGQNKEETKYDQEVSDKENMGSKENNKQDNSKKDSKSSNSFKSKEKELNKNETSIDLDDDGNDEKTIY